MRSRSGSKNSTRHGIKSGSDRSPRFVFDKRWYGYAIAGAGAIAAAPAAHATIITDAGGFTPFTLSASCAPIGSPCSQSQTFSLTGAAAGSFTIKAQVSNGSASLFFGGFGAAPAGAYDNGGPTPSLSAGTLITDVTAGFSYNATSHQVSPQSTWNGGDSFIGLEFNSGGIHFGWVELNRSFVQGANPLTDPSTYTVTVEGFAYETNVDTGILAGDTGVGPVAPEPATAGLVLLALGAGALGAWRKRKAQQA